MRTNRSHSQLRPIKIETDFTPHAEGSVLYSCGNTRVLCNISIEEGVPKFLKDSNSGWLTAEYSLLPRSTHTRCAREATRGKQSGRTVEIQRLIGRSIRAMVDLNKLPGLTIAVDCDVLVADGGTRTAAINGSAIALILALQKLQYKKVITADPLLRVIGAVSVGIHNNDVLLDLDYHEDSQIDTDLNLVLDEHGSCIEIQGTAEKSPLPLTTLSKAIDVAHQGINSIIAQIKQSASLIAQD